MGGRVGFNQAKTLSSIQFRSTLSLYSSSFLLLLLLFQTLAASSSTDSNTTQHIHRYTLSLFNLPHQKNLNFFTFSLLGLHFDFTPLSFHIRFSFYCVGYDVFGVLRNGFELVWEMNKYLWRIVDLVLLL